MHQPLACTHHCSSKILLFAQESVLPSQLPLSVPLLTLILAYSVGNADMWLGYTEGAIHATCAFVCCAHLRQCRSRFTHGVRDTGTTRLFSPPKRHSTQARWTLGRGHNLCARWHIGVMGRRRGRHPNHQEHDHIVLPIENIAEKAIRKTRDQSIMA